MLWSPAAAQHGHYASDGPVEVASGWHAGGAHQQARSFEHEQQQHQHHLGASSAHGQPGWHGEPAPYRGHSEGPGSGHAQRPSIYGGHEAPRYVEDVPPRYADHAPPMFAEDLPPRHGEPPWHSGGQHAGFAPQVPPEAEDWHQRADPGQCQHGLHSKESHYSQYSHYSGQSGYSQSGHRSQPSGFRRPAPRPPASEGHHRLAQGRRQRPGGLPVGREGRGDKGSWEDPGRGGGGGGSSDEERPIDHGLIVQRLGKFREAERDKLGGHGGRGPYGGEVMEVQDIPRPPPAPQRQCGKARLKMRQKFNRSEIDVAKVIRSYDTDQDWKLEVDEFRVLLQDYNRWFKHITPEELAMVMKVADIDQDDCIEPGEVLYALRVWYAYVSMPRAVTGVLASLSDSTMPSLETLREALLLLNEEQPVAAEEALYVRHMALALGGTEQRVSARHIRMAIAAWYLHIERKETARGELAKHAMAGAHEHICLQNPVQKFCRGNCDPFTMACMGLITVVWGIIPTLSVWIGSTQDTSGYPCEKPWLSISVLLTGYASLGQAAAAFWLIASWECTAVKGCRMAAGSITAGMSIVVCGLWLTGLWQIMTATPSTCGFIIWEFGNLIWVFQPAVIMLFFCCCLPAIYCAEYYNNKRVDASLMEPYGAGHDDSE